MDNGTLKTFGDGFNHPDLEHIENPDCDCHYCGESIEAWEAGFSSLAVMPADDAEFKSVAYRIYEHRECFLRQMVGSTAHILKRCGCFIPGAHDGDAPGLTPRQAAREAVATYYRQQNYGSRPEIKTHIQRQDN